MTSLKKLNNIPTNILTGFLGVGKTTAIQNLLKNKPQAERWAVLINEFGEVGIDGSLLGGNYSEEAGVYLREVPGGCMCCAAGLPMQIALNVLLNKARPDRLLIEPTGLGHPQEVLAVLCGDYYRNVLDVRATITLLDARKLSDKRYLDNAIFQQQLAIADRVVANKADLYQATDYEILEQFCENHAVLANIPVHIVEHAQVQLIWLDAENLHIPNLSEDQDAPSKAFVATSFAPILPEAGYLRVNNHGQGFNSCGWLFNTDFVFDNDALYNLLLGVDAVRLKAVFITTDGVVGYNKVDDITTCIHLDDALDSRIELISSAIIDMDALEKKLLKCVVP